MAEQNTTDIVDGILTAILQWRVNWLDEQKNFPKPPPICRAELKKLKITYDNYKDYESTFVPLLMHEIWAQIFEEWNKLENEINGGVPMETDDPFFIHPNNSSARTIRGFKKPDQQTCPRQFPIGVLDYRGGKLHQCVITCQYLIDTHQAHNHLKIIGEGDLVRLDLAIDQSDVHNVRDPSKKQEHLSLFGYVIDVTSERLTKFSELSECFTNRSENRNIQIIQYKVVIAKRQLRLNKKLTMRISGLYYLKPMIRQIESVTTLLNSALASDILSPKLITCQLSVPTIVNIKSPHYNDMQYKAIIGANEALVRNIPKIQLIQGPPGTGKTHTLIGIIKHFYLKWQDSVKLPKLLICAPSNGAIDEVGRRLHKEREFLKKGPAQRSLRMVRIGHPDQISENLRQISLEELVETNAKFKIEEIKRKQQTRIKELESELSRCDTEITNLRYLQREKEIPQVETTIARLFKELELAKSSEEVRAKREVSEASKKNMRFELVRNADVILTTLNSCQRHPLDALFKGDRADLSFHCVIVDEASQCCEPELLMPLCYKISKMILIGDPMQLPATVISRHAQDFDFGRSLFERFFIHFGKYDTGSPIAMLTNQYRMHPDICDFPSKHFYDGRLISAKSFTANYPLKPYIVFDLRNSTETRSNGTSLENQAEANLVKNLLLAVLTKAPENTKVGVITPYRGQKRLITNKISNLQSQRNISIDVNTCDGFQGQEKDIIILSCVRAFESGGNIGFLKSTQRMNVALTRAKYSLILCVSAKSLSKDKVWQALVEDAGERKVLQTLTQVPNPNNLVNMIANSPTNSKTQYRFTQSQLVRAREAPETNESEFVPEYVMPMDID